MSLRTRLQRLERHLGNSGCPACRERCGLVVLLTARREPDGTVVCLDEWPRPCERCGQVPEQIIEVVESVIDEPINSPAPELLG